MNLHLVMPEPDPIEIDPRPCEWCGLKIDQHEMIDDGDGPVFFCLEAESPDAADIVRRWELADPRDRWKWTGEAPPAPQADPPPGRAAYTTPQSTIDAFFYVVSLDDTDYLARWMAQHKPDAAQLLKIWERKCSRANNK